MSGSASGSLLHRRDGNTRIRIFWPHHCTVRGSGDTVAISVWVKASVQPLTDLGSKSSSHRSTLRSLMQSSQNTIYSFQDLRTQVGFSPWYKQTNKQEEEGQEMNSAPQSPQPAHSYLITPSLPAEHDGILLLPWQPTGRREEAVMKVTQKEEGGREG